MGGIVVSRRATSEDVVCFDGFELEVRTAELRNPEGQTVRLSEQPLRILIALLEHPGDLVLREDLRMRLWPNDTIVEFEHSTNAAVNRLRQVLRDSAENPKFIETLARRGYRWKTPVQWKKPLAVPAPSGLTDVRCEPATGLRAELKQVKDYSESGKIAVKPISPDEASEHRKLRAVLAVCIATGMLAAAGTWYLRYGNKAQIDSIAVLPFINESGDANIDYLSDSIAESLTDSLTQIPQLKVKSRRSAFQFKGKNVSLQKVGSELGVSVLVSGRVVPHGDNIEVNAELTDVRDNTEMWAQHYSGKSTEIASLQLQIAGDIAEKLRSKLSTPEKRRALWRIRVWQMPIPNYLSTVQPSRANTIRSRNAVQTRLSDWRASLGQMSFPSQTRPLQQDDARL